MDQIGLVENFYFFFLGKNDIYPHFTLILHIYGMFATYYTFTVHSGKLVIFDNFRNRSIFFFFLFFLLLSFQLLVLLEKSPFFFLVSPSPSFSFSSRLCSSGSMSSFWSVNDSITVCINALCLSVVGIYSLPSFNKINIKTSIFV